MCFTDGVPRPELKKGTRSVHPPGTLVRWKVTGLESKCPGQLALVVETMPEARQVRVLWSEPCKHWLNSGVLELRWEWEVQPA